MTSTSSAHAFDMLYLPAHLFEMTEDVLTMDKKDVECLLKIGKEWNAQIQKADQIQSDFIPFAKMMILPITNSNNMFNLHSLKDMLGLYKDMLSGQNTDTTSKWKLIHMQVLSDKKQEYVEDSRFSCTLKMLFHLMNYINDVKNISPEIVKSSTHVLIKLHNVRTIFQLLDMVAEQKMRLFMDNTRFVQIVKDKGKELTRDMRKQVARFYKRDLSRKMMEKTRYVITKATKKFP